MTEEVGNKLNFDWTTTTDQWWERVKDNDIYNIVGRWRTNTKRNENIKQSMIINKMGMVVKLNILLINE